MHIGLEFDSLGFQLAQPAVDDALFQFEVRNAIAQQSAHAVRLLKYGNQVAGAVELLRRRQTGRSGADHSDVSSAAQLGRLRNNRALTKRMFNDAVLNQLDRNRGLIDSQNTGSFTGRGTDPPRKLRKIVGAMQNAQGIAPAVLINQVVPLWYDVVQRAASVAKRYAAIH